MTTAARVSTYISLGSNLENPLRQVSSAVDELGKIKSSRLVARSPWYRSQAIGPVQPDFINGVAQLDTTLEAEALLDALQNIEHAHKRVRSQHWGPRTLDLDLLLYGDQRITTARLTVPHPELPRRGFVLYPLADLAPKLILPNGLSIESLLTHCHSEGLERIGDSPEPGSMPG
ncbi:MAG: 2-amino-4-hydroxy-6-hydroxymethyldihydropteridine diphosphokinase [Exilibacterium sp.]